MKYSQKKDFREQIPYLVKKGSRWSQKEKDFVMKNYRTMSIADMARKIGRGYHSLDGFLYVNNLYKNRLTIKRQNLKGISHLSPTQWAYLAGIVDGEGTITIQKTYQKYYRPYVQVANTSTKLLKHFIKLGFYGVLEANGNNRPYWRIEVSGYQIESLIDGLMPFLIIKKDLALLTKEFITIRLSQPHRTKPNKRMEEIYQAIKKRNTRGLHTKESLTKERQSMT